MPADPTLEMILRELAALEAASHPTIGPGGVVGDPHEMYKAVSLLELSRDPHTTAKIRKRISQELSAMRRTMPPGAERTLSRLSFWRAAPPARTERALAQARTKWGLRPSDRPTNIRRQGVPAPLRLLELINRRRIEASHLDPRFRALYDVIRRDVGKGPLRTPAAGRVGRLWARGLKPLGPLGVLLGLGLLAMSMTEEEDYGY